MNIKDVAILKSIKTGQTTLLQAVAATVQKLTLEQKAAMDESLMVGVHKSVNDYIITPVVSPDGAIPDFTTYTEADPNLKLTINSSTQYTVAGLVETDANIYLGKQVAAHTNFLINFTFVFTASQDNNYYRAAILFGNQLSLYTDVAFNGVGVFIDLHGTAVSRKMMCGKSVNGTVTTGTGITIVVGNTYYGTITRFDSTLTLNLYSDAGRTTLVAGSPINLTGVPTTSFNYFFGMNSGQAALGTGGGFTVLGVNDTNNPLTGTIKSAAITKDANIGLRYWGNIIANLVAGAAGSTIAAKICDSAGTPLHSNFVTIDSSEYARIPLERSVVLTASSGGQTVWDFTSLSNADAFINELGVLAKALIVELALDGTNYTVLKEVTNFNEDISNILAPRITLVSGMGVVNGTSKLRATYIVNISLSNTTIKLQVQLNRLAVGDTSPSIQPFVGDATKYVGAGQVAII